MKYFKPILPSNDESYSGYYTAVLHGEYNPRTRCFEWAYDENHTTFVTAKVLKRTVMRLKEGHSHVTADPMFGVNRTEAGFLLANADELLKTINKSS